MLSAEYFAGFFDGEGTICILKRDMSLVVSIVNTHQPILLLIQAQYGGSFHDRNDRGSYVLKWVSNKAVPVIEVMYPHLILKRAQADLALAFQHLVTTDKRNRWDSPETKLQKLEEREWFRSELNGLNGSQYGRTDGV